MLEAAMVSTSFRTDGPRQCSLQNDWNNEPIFVLAHVMSTSCYRLTIEILCCDEKLKSKQFAVPDMRLSNNNMNITNTIKIKRVSHYAYY
jgi:hypothetical protein